jgi:hypothetical protein
MQLRKQRTHPRTQLHMHAHTHTHTHTQEFRRLDSQLGAARDRAELLASSAGDTLPLLSVQVRTLLPRQRACL